MGRYRASLITNGVRRRAPIDVRMIQHNVDEMGHQVRHDGRPVAHLFPVDSAPPSCTAMQELVAEHVEPFKYLDENRAGFAS